ncbi:hypothetical protein BTE77_35405 [Ensifer adhaerens]|nr:hypothetical protein BTE77_35405 [Ensifer adhaerens]
MEPICVKLPEIRCNLEGFSRLADLYADLRHEALESILIDCSGTNWFHANMSAPFGVILDHIASLNHVRPFNFPQKVEQILRRNNFLLGYRYEKMQDIYHTAIPYQRFAINEHNSFALHIAEHLQPNYVPEMSAELKNRFVQSIHEIFANSAMHSETSHGIHVCGRHCNVNAAQSRCWFGALVQAV